MKKLRVNVAQNIHHSQFLPRTFASVNPKPGGFCQSSAKRSDGQGSGQGRHQAPLRLFGQRGASSSPPCRRDRRTRWGVHNYPIFLSAVCGFVSFRYQDLEPTKGWIERSVNSVLLLITVTVLLNRWGDDDNDLTLSSLLLRKKRRLLNDIL